MGSRSEPVSDNLINLSDSEPWRRVNAFRLIEGLETFPGAEILADKIAKVLNDFESNIQKAFRASMTDAQD